MAERIVSPGVFTRERDLSFLPQAIGEIGAAIVGPTVKGPAFVPTQITSFQDFEEMFGGQDERFYTPYTVEQYLKSAGVVTIVRVLGLGGYVKSAIRLGVVTGSATSSFTVLAPSAGAPASFADFSGSSLTGDFASFTLTVSGSAGFTEVETYDLSFDTGSSNYITKVISSDPLSEKSGNSNSSVYVYKNWSRQPAVLVPHGNKNATSASIDIETLNFIDGRNTIDNDGNESTDWDGNKDFQTARTPFIQSQLLGGDRFKLFRIYSRSHGSNVNSELKIGIRDIKSADDIAGSDYGTFSIVVKVNNPGGIDDDTILEQFDNLTFDSESPNYFAKRIGDRHVTIDANGKLTFFGTLPNLSKHIRVGDYNSKTTGENNLARHPKEVVPFGFEALYNTVPDTSSATGSIPAAVYVTNQTNDNNVYDGNIFYGFDFTSKFIRDDNANYLAPIPFPAQFGNNVSMSLDLQSGSAEANPNGESTFADETEGITLTNSTLAQRKFMVPLQWGFDGRNPATPFNVGTQITSTNTQGFDLSSSTSSGSLAYKRAINAISNPDEFDINLLVTPGVIHRLHSNITNHAISKVESRADALYIMDSAAYNDSVETVLDTVKNLDTNYVATYYPWVMIPNRDSSIPVWVPPSVVLPGVIAFNDQVAHEWFAPAGLNRGGLTSVLEAKTRLTHSERDDLYEGRVNPIASFPGQGVVVFGQKTLQSKPSALDRVNVRRLLISLRKFIASSSRFLVFEQNTQALRNRFLNIVNPFLEQVQSNSGLSAFRVVMDDTNNTPEVVDRNQLVGQIFIQPTRTAEFIILDFVVQPTGATFPE